MKTIKLNLLIVLMVVSSGYNLIAKEEFTKKINKSFEVNKDATLSVKNKFGKVHCANWDKNMIAIEVIITVEASNQDEANKYFDKIKISISGNSSRVTASTSFGNDIFSNNNNDINIDYMITMPKTVNIELDNKFGDIIIDEVLGSSNIELGYGTIKCKKLAGDKNDLEIKFSEGFIGYVKSADLELKYSELEIDEVNDMTAESKFSELEIGKIDVLTLESGYDDDFIGNIRDLDIEANFSDVDVRSLEDRLVADFDYGELKVRDVAKDFKIIDITNSFSDTNIGFNKECSFRMITTLKMGDLSYPKNKARLSVVDLSLTSNKYEGVIGDNENTASKVIIESKNSDVTLYFR